MVKRTIKKKVINKVGKARARAKPRGMLVRALDGPASNYARLMADPCGAPVVGPVYPGGDAGYLFRAESWLTTAASAGQTSGYIHWTPGYTNSGGTQLLDHGAVDATTAAANTTRGALAPGSAFLTANARGVRCVAACMRLSFPGAESSRAGRLHYGHTPAGLIDAGQSVAVDSVVQALQHYTRTPPEVVEIVWKPNIGDCEFNDPAEATGALIRDRKSSITAAWAGLPAATGMLVHLTAVYEWTPNVGVGVAGNVTGKVRSRNSLDDVLDSLMERGFSFVRHAGAAAGTAAYDMVTRQFGLMGARPMSRSRAFAFE